MNLKSAASVTPTPYHLKATDTAQDIIPTVQAGGVVKIETMIVSNVNGTENKSFTLTIVEGAVTQTIGKDIVVPAGAAIEFFGRPHWLSEGQSLQGVADEADAIEFSGSGLEFV